MNDRSVEKCWGTNIKGEVRHFFKSVFKLWTGAHIGSEQVLLAATIPSLHTGHSQTPSYCAPTVR